MKKGLKVSYIPYFHEDMNDAAFSQKYNYRWSSYLKKMIEKDGGEIHTYDILPFEEADAILSFDNVYFQNNRLFMDLYKCDKLGCTTHIDYEPPSANCRIHSDDGLIKLSNLFKSLITYNDNVVNNDTIIKGCIGDFYSKELKYENNFKKRKLLTMITNNRVGGFLYGPHPNELYSKRQEAVLYFQDKCPKDFDLYGDFWPDEYKKCWVKKLSRDEKNDYLKNYKFIISYDSICKQNGYISEKIFDCFKAKVVPIYWGAENVTDYIPKECFIDRRNFSSYDELYDYLVNMKEDEYNKYIHAIEKYLKSSSYLSLFSSQASAEIIYKELCKEKRILNDKVVKNILDEFEKKRTTDPKCNCPHNCFDYHYPLTTTIYDIKEKRENNELDLILLTYLYYSKNYDITLYGKSKKDGFYKLDYSKSDYDIVYNGYKIELKIGLLDVQAKKGISLYTYDNNEKKYTPLKIERNVPTDDFLNEFNIVIENNSFKYKINKKEKIIRFLKKYHLYRFFRIVYKILHIPISVLRRIKNRK